MDLLTPTLGASYDTYQYFLVHTHIIYMKLSNKEGT